MMIRYTRGTSCLKFQKDTIKITHTTVKPNVINEATKERKRKVFHKQEGIEEREKIYTKEELKMAINHIAF